MADAFPKTPLAGERQRDESVLDRKGSSTFSSAWIAGEARAAGFFPADIREPAARIAAAKRAAARAIAPELLAALRDEDRALPASALRREHLDSLGAPGTVAVVTGQQAGLFLGPLYTFYKAASAIALARAIERESGVHCVPIFWLQSEDHDFAEIDHCHLAGPDGARLRLQLEPAADGAAGRVSVAHRRLGEGVRGPLETLERTLSGLAHATEMVTLLRAHYRPDHSICRAFAGVIAALFADEGLIVFDPRQAAVARLAAPVYRRALVEFEAIAGRLSRRGAELREAGFAEQVRLRSDSPLVFFHADAATGPRHRLSWRDGRFALAGAAGSFSRAELIAILDGEPLRFTASALLRPIVQDALFPTVAYVGGPGEVNYFAQLEPLYEAFGVPRPLLALRARFRVLDGGTRSLLRRLELSAADVTRSREELLRKVAGRSSPDHGAAEDWRERFIKAITPPFDAFEVMASSIDANLVQSTQRTRARITHLIDRLIERRTRALLENDRVATDRVDRLRNVLYPDGIPQERFYSLAHFAARYGIGRFKQAVFTALDPFDTAVRDIDP